MTSSFACLVARQTSDARVRGTYDVEISLRSTSDMVLIPDSSTLLTPESLSLTSTTGDDASAANLGRGYSAHRKSHSRFTKLEQ